ncbi:uncharacterized protein LOC133723235 [Rosa rugosa]|uniref:uncharacterized protein LOC133723235 n=1 Tax=Rosa rugosa TaxID=74645 RepID=UPI002B401D3A|nr:uncharacterized protein LOC133723235 [Rosa rugosa]
MKSGLLQRLPIFHGFNVEDPNKHLKEFLFVCSSMTPQEVDEDIFKLKAFPFSPEDRAKDWLYELPKGHITSWNGLMKAFLEKYFPTSRVLMLRKKITGITQDVHETYQAYYERFKALLSQCPQHNFKDENLLQFFYEGLTHLDRQMLDAASGGAFVDKTPSEETQQGHSKDILELKEQMGQVLSCIGMISNPKRQFVEAVTTRSGRTLVDPRKKGKKAQAMIEEEEEDVESSNRAHEKDPATSKVEIQASPTFAKSKKEEEEKAILEIFKKVQVNIPLIECLTQIPKYTKYLKELCTTRRRTREKKVVKMSENVSAVIQRKLPPKLKDPGSFSIPCTIDLGELKYDNVIIQLADRSNAYPKGYVEDVLVQVNSLIFLTDFYVLEMGESPQNSTPFLLGRPFMRTARTKIDVFNGSLTMEFDGEVISFNVFEVMRYPLSNDYSVSTTDLLDSLAQKIFEVINEDTLITTMEKGLGYSSTGKEIPLREFKDDVLNDKVFESVAYLESTPPIVGKVPKPLSIQLSTNKHVPSVIQAPTLELKPLPNHLKYAFLGDNDTLPVIVSSKLTVEQEGKLVDVLRKHKTAIGWTLADIKGISLHVVSTEYFLRRGRNPQ